MGASTKIILTLPSTRHSHGTHSAKYHLLLTGMSLNGSS